MPQVDDKDRNSDGRDGKVWEQIGEILDREEKSAPQKPQKINIARPTAPRRARTGTPIWYPTPEKLMALGIGLMVIAVIARQAVLPLTLAGFAMAGIGYYMLLKRKRRAKWGGSPSSAGGPAPSQYWRGRPVKPGKPVKKRDGNILEFPGADEGKQRGRFGRKR